MVGPEQGEDTSPSPLLIQTFVDTSLLETGLPSDSKIGYQVKGLTAEAGTIPEPTWWERRDISCSDFYK